MNLTFDPTANAAYLTLGAPVEYSDRQVAELTLDGLNGGVILDIDATGHIIGIEFIGARELLTPEVIEGGVKSC